MTGAMFLSPIACSGLFLLFNSVPFSSILTKTQRPFVDVKVASNCCLISAVLPFINRTGVRLSMLLEGSSEPQNHNRPSEEKTRCDQRMHFCQLMKLLASITLFIHEEGWPSGNMFVPCGGNISNVVGT